MKTTEAVSAANQLLLHLGWKQSDETPTGQLWERGEARVSFSNELRRPGVAWRTFLTGLSSVERHTPVELEELLDRILLVEAPVEKLKRPALRAELDLHINPAAGSHEHETDAWEFGSFVRASADAVNELLKNHFGVERHGRKLQVFGGATDGSVRIRLREPSLEIGAREEALFSDGGEPPERKALIILAQLINTAEDASKSPHDSTLDAQLNVGKRARSALLRLARTTVDSGWTVTGNLLVPHKESLGVRLTPAGANRLAWAAREAREETYEEVLRGTVDGWLWGEAEMRLKTPKGTVRAAVPMALQEDVAHLNTHPTHLVTARFGVLERLASDQSLVSRSRALLSITPDEGLPVEEDGTG